ncbi:MAG: response regulator, partial [Planctomycetes bacterium]|nr:response regulator [Planctomycetota bacterium]
LPSRTSDGPTTPARFQGRVLVVEDNALNQRIAVRLLERHGLCADVAANGAEALVAVERADYQLVLMDCHMPVMDGFEATRRLRERESTRSVERLPIVALSAGLRPEDRKRCLEQGMDEFLSKPFPLAALERVLQRFLAREPARES